MKNHQDRTVRSNKNKRIKLSESTNSFRNQYKKVDFALFAAMAEELDYIHAVFSSCKYEHIKIEGFDFKIYNYNGRRIVVAYTGLGTIFAASVVTFIHFTLRPSYFLLSGTAGGVNPEIKVRDVVIIEKAFEAEIQGAFELLKTTPFESCLKHPLNQQHFPSIYPADQKLLEIANNIKYEGIKIHKGTGVTSNAFPAPKELFDKIKSKNPQSIDMETSAFYQIAWFLNIRVLAIRGISNVLDVDGTDKEVNKSDVRGGAEAAAKVLMKIVNAIIDYDKALASEAVSAIDKKAEHIIKEFKLQPHPEGGYYARNFQSEYDVASTDSDRYNGETRKAGTSIYYLLSGTDFSAWHSLKSDELWHYYKGSPVKIHVIDKNGSLNSYLLGDPTENHGAVFQLCIKAGDWFAAEVADKTSYSFVGCTVSPGFEFKDFTLADRTLLSNMFPQHETIINRFTRMVEKSELKESINPKSERILARL